jgi:hypothetical protein
MSAEQVLAAPREGGSPYVALDIDAEGNVTASPAFDSRSALLRWQRAHPAPWGVQRRVIDGKAARAWR